MSFTFKEAKWNKETGMWDFANGKPDPDFFGGLGPMNTVADFVSELNDCFFRDILGDETMDRALGSFEKEDLFRVMARIFLNTGFEKWAMKS